MTELTWTVPLAHPAFPGHFPGQPILPGVVLLDQAIALAATVLAPDTTILGLGNAKFFRPVRPGTRLVFRFPPTGAAAQAFEILDGDQLVASGSLSLSPRP
ncbi:hypothetical protein [Zoogloea sp.]|uniref:3-hydroxyacyl-ACP dehydratase FabZ family protein n=1 Tax=Zoogloea sp. TaxID=49181 RepID=UPI001416CAA6|nr:MAG: beta-hydroxyacyl-ACP dehydratase [Zoogloea sp.]